MSRKLLLVFVLGAVSSVAFGAVKTCTWTGRGDGYRLSDANNWDVSPVSGDALVLTNRTTSLLVLTNDLGSVESPFHVQAIVAGGQGAIHLVGNPLGVTPKVNGDSLVFNCPFTNDVDLVYDTTGGRTHVQLGTSLTESGETVNGSIVQNGKISSTGAYNFRLRLNNLTGSQRSAFNGDIEMPNADIANWGGNNSLENRIYGRVVAASFNCKDGAQNPGNSGSMRGIWYLHHADNDIDTVDLNSRRFYVYGDNGFGSNAIIRTGAPNDSFATVYYANGTTQKVKGFARNPSYLTTAVTSGNNINAQDTSASGKPVQFVVCATNDTVCEFFLSQNIALTWDPTDDCTLDYARSGTIRADKPITVKRGTMSVSGAATFTSLPEIKVASGATFEMIGGSTSALTGLTKVSLADGATFRLGANEVTPFTANKAVFFLRGSAKIDLACAVTTPVSVFVDGTPVTSGTYSAASWLTGSGSLVVAEPADYYWTGETDSDWNKDANWLHGVPQLATTKAAYVNKVGTTTVDITADAPAVTSLAIENEDGKTTLTVDAAFAVSNGTVTVGRGAEVKVGSSGTLTYGKTSKMALTDGGTITVNGGDFRAHDLAGTWTIGGGDASVTSTLSIVSGSCDITLPDRRRFLLDRGGLIKMTGGTFRQYYTYSGGLLDQCFTMTGGAIDLSGTAVMNVEMNASQLFGDGSIRIADTAKLVVNKQASRCGFVPKTENGLLSIEVLGQGELSHVQDQTYINNAALVGGVTRITASDSAKVKLGNMAVIGAAKGGTGEVVLKDSAALTDAMYAITFGKGGGADGVSTGVLRMSGGTVTVTSQPADYPSLRGLIFGDGASTTATGEIRNRGYGYISGGTLSVRSALYVGDGNAYGQVEQSGGTMNMNNTPAYVGSHCGTGVYRLTGTGVYSGGTGTMNVGANDGTGTLELGVGTGSFTAKNLNLAGAKSTLKFVLGADGSVIKPNLTDTLTVGTGAKLVIDATGYAGKGLDLMTFANRVGSFAAADITIVGAKSASVVQEGTRLRFRPSNGLVFVVR